MKLYIAEKPSLARAIAAALPKPHKKQNGFIEVGNGDCVSWCIGHILAQANPEDYDLKYKKWRSQDLPIMPDKWQLKPIAKTKSQLTVLRKLVSKAKVLVHAGDPDREGQLLVDEVIDYLNVPTEKKQRIERLLINDLNTSAVKKALATSQPNSNFMPLSISALARSRADWLYGINLTRAYTLQGQSKGFHGVLSVGRVQTPILGLVVQRDRDISNFVSKPFYEVLAHIETPNQQTFTAKWQPSDNCQPYMDEEGRVLNHALAKNVVARITNQPAAVKSIDNKPKQEFAPLAFSLSSLQIAAAKQYGFSAQQVLDSCQQLYERHQLITYPRSDCRYLPTAQHNQAPTIIAHLSQGTEPIASYAQQANTGLKSKTWNDKKVSAHHAIIPTEKSASSVQLSKTEALIYQLIARQFVAQFYDNYQYLQTTIVMEIAGGKFVSKAIEIKELGWKSLFKSLDKIDDVNTLPPVKQNDQLWCKSGEVLSKQTQPPKPFTDATLLAAMTGIARYVTSSEVKKILKDTDGLGTEATRASIIELLFKRQFLQRTGKTIQATELGTVLINALPASATTPDMTAQWEANLNAIAEKASSYQHFMQPLCSKISAMIAEAAAAPMHGLPQQAFKPKRRFKKRTNRGQSKKN